MILLAAAGLHAGFQLVVTVVVYPALADVPPERWAPAHDAHSRRIGLLVVPLYLLVLVACGAAVLDRQLGDPATVVALLGQAVALLVTATLAAPTHGLLARRGPEPALVRRLLGIDRLRCAAAVVGLVAALVACT